MKKLLLLIILSLLSLNLYAISAEERDEILAKYIHQLVNVYHKLPLENTHLNKFLFLSADGREDAILEIKKADLKTRASARLYYEIVDPMHRVEIYTKALDLTNKEIRDR